MCNLCTLRKPILNTHTHKLQLCGLLCKVATAKAYAAISLSFPNIFSKNTMYVDI